MTGPADHRTAPRSAPDEALTRRAVARYAVLDTPPDTAFDEVVDLALRLTGARRGGIAFLDRERVWFKARRRLAETAWPRAQFPVSWTGPGPHTARERRSPAGVTVLDGPFTVGDRCYTFAAAAPVTTGEGYHIGQLIVLDETPLTPEEEDLAALAVLSRQVMSGLELRRTMMSYRAAVDGVGHVVFQLDEQHRLLSVTPSWVRLTGFGVVRSVGSPLADYLHPDDRAGALTHLADLQGRNTTTTFECRLRHLTGGDTPVEVIARPVVDENDRQRGLVGVAADISDRKAQEIEARHAQKLEALGRLSAGLAHEINTPIQFVGDNIRFLAGSYQTMLGLIGTYRQALGTVPDPRDPAGPGNPPDPGDPVGAERIRAAEDEADLDYLSSEVPEAIRQSLDGVERVAALIRAMRTFGQADRDVQAAADLNAALRSVVAIALTQVGDTIRIDCDLADLPAVTCTLAEITEVVLNMLINAADAIEEKGGSGAITVRSRLCGEEVSVEVSDTGAGIPEEIRHRIFEPFFTTKEVGRGTGQGLALARSVIRDKHGGTIAMSSAVGVGTTFTLTLPVAGRRTADTGIGAADPARTPAC
ncbi:MAG: ATP-binding protein [Kineosporiaceae bacterium]